MEISIIICVYNAQKTIKRAIDSVLSQNFPQKDFEVIVVNDGSIDNTLKILKTYREKIKIIDQKNQGAVKATNKGFKKALGRYVIKLDADDYFETNILEEMAKMLKENPEIDFVYADYYEKAETGEIKIVSTKNIFHTIACGVMYKRSKLSEEGFYKESVKLPEYDLLLKIYTKWQGYHVSKPLYYYIRRKESLSGEKKWIREAIDELKKLHPKKIKEIKKIREY